MAKTAPTRIVWRQQYDDVRDAIEREATNAVNDEPTMTVQSFRDDCDMNIVLPRFGITDGSVPPAQLMTLPNLDEKYYGDFTDTVDMQTQLDRIRTAYDHFDNLPAELRARFDNDPRELYAWVNNPANKEEAIALRILRDDPTKIPVPTTAAERANAKIAQLQADLAAKAPPVPAATTPAPTPSTQQTTPT